MDLRTEFGDIDIYLFDQLLRQRIRPGMRIYDAGCGNGRNLVFALRAGYEVRAVDADRSAIEEVQRLASALAPQLAPDSFRNETIEAATIGDGWADVVIVSAVLHFATDEPHFASMLRGAWRALAPHGLLFCRLASSIGIADRVRPIGHGRYRLPDGSDRYLVDEAGLIEWTARLGGDLADPIKTTVVQDQRAMTTWVVRKR
jgi:SAM-dependent methyltransferase